MRAGAVLTGSLQAITLFDLCQYLVLEKRTGTLVARHRDATARIHFKEGRILDVDDGSQCSGEEVLQEAVQWRDGTFTFDPMPVAVKPRLTGSTEELLLSVARAVDRLRARLGLRTEEFSQEALFRERQAYAGELADTFSAATEPVDQIGVPDDPLHGLLNDLQKVHGTLLVRGRAGILRGANGVQPYTVEFDMEELLRELQLPVPKPGEVFNRRFTRARGWYHLRARHFGGELQVLLASLQLELPRPESIGLDAAALDPLLEKGRGLILWTGVPRGHRSKSLRYWLGHASDPAYGTTLWLEEAPRVAWEVVSWTSRHVGDPQAIEGAAGLLEWNPEIVVVDPVRLPSAARLALEMAEAGAKTIAVATGLNVSAAVTEFRNMLLRCSVPEAGDRLGRILAGWVGILPLKGKDPDLPIVATQIARSDADLGLVLARGASKADLERWERICRPSRSFVEDIARLERAGRVDPSVKTQVRLDYPMLGL
jgi:hypothetical protein